MSHTTEQPVHHSRVEALDLLRLLAALAVVFYHFVFHGPGGFELTSLSLPEAAAIAKYGYLGVPLFFVISGFVIAYSAEGRTAREFVAARIARIYPGFLICMTLTFLAITVLGGPRIQASVWQWLANIAIAAPAFDQPYMDSAYWSIVVEVVFYGWVAIFIAAGLFSSRLSPLVAAWLLVSIVNEVFIDSFLLRKLLITNYSGFFAAGLMLYALHAGRRDALIWSLLGAATLLGAFQSDWVAASIVSRSNTGLSRIVVAAASVGAVALVGACARIRRLPVSSATALAIGAMTYPLYLLHQMLGYIIFNQLEGWASPAVLVAVALAAVLALSWIVQRFAERPTQRIVKRGLSRILGTGRQQPAAGGTPYQMAQTRGVKAEPDWAKTMRKAA